MLKSFTLLLSVLFLIPSPASAFVPAEQRTLFHEDEIAWAVGTISLGKPMDFRDGQVLAFPTQIVDLLWAPDGTKPRNLMLVHDVAKGEKEKPFLQKGDEIFCPIKLLPEHSYWKDNLPNTRRHSVAGGRRYMFRGKEIPEVRAILDAYLKAFQSHGRERWTGEVEAVANALGSTIPVVREDAVRYFQIYPTLARDFEPAALPAVESYLKGDAQAQEKEQLIHALVLAKVPGLEPILQTLAARQDGTGAAALGGLAESGIVPSVEELLTLSNSSSVEVKAFAVFQLARQAGTSAEALKRVVDLLEDDKTAAAVQTAAVEGLVVSANDAAVVVLGAQLRRGGTNSRIAGDALGRIGGPKSAQILMVTLKEGKGEAAIAAAMGLGRSTTCAECHALLVEQHESHEDQSVRDFIGVLLGVPLEHKH